MSKLVAASFICIAMMITSITLHQDIDRLIIAIEGLKK
jgi:hypothetical protein